MPSFQIVTVKLKKSQNKRNKIYFKGAGQSGTLIALRIVLQSTTRPAWPWCGHKNEILENCKIHSPF
jgi:hypothetical protein